MPFREAAHLPTCVQCRAAGVPCQNCEAIHCLAHLNEGACTSCVAQLWQLERRRMHGLATGLAALGVPLSVGGLICIMHSPLAAIAGFAAIAVTLVGALGLSKARPRIRASLASKSLPPRSQQLLPPGPAAKTQAQGSRKRSRALVSRQRNANERIVGQIASNRNFS